MPSYSLLFCSILYRSLSYESISYSTKSLFLVSFVFGLKVHSFIIFYFNSDYVFCFLIWPNYSFDERLNGFGIVVWNPFAPVSAFPARAGWLRFEVKSLWRSGLFTSYWSALTANLWLMPKTSASRSFWSSAFFFLSSYSSRCLPRPRTTTIPSLLSIIAALVYGWKVHLSSSSISLLLLSATILAYFSFSFFFRFIEKASPPYGARVPGTFSYLLLFCEWS